MISVLILISVLSLKASALCDFPCTWQDQTWYLATADVDLALPTSSQLEVSDDGTVVATLECYARLGSFFITRRPGDEYRCFKIIHTDENVFTLRQTTLVTMPGSSPDFCTLCSQIDDSSDLEVWTATENTELGCNIPKNCPSGADDTPCTGCEDGVPDDGHCCDCSDTYTYDAGYQYPTYDTYKPGKGKGGKKKSKKM